jgi:glutamine cyclotransferase
MTRRIVLLILLAVCALAAPVVAQDATPEATPEATPDGPIVSVFVPQVVNQIPHSVTDFTQGLVWSADGRLFQSAGQYGESRIQELDPETGEALREVPLDEQYFAEGLALVDDRLIQLTWREQTALVWDADTFEQTGTFSYETEGWGLCYDGEALWLSDGSPNLFRHDPETFELLDTVPVTLDGDPVANINELECVDGAVWANVWQTPFIIRIDPASGAVTGVVDVRPIITPEIVEAWQTGAVLNGIAYKPDSETFLITGKDWPVMYEVTFTAVEPAQ